MKEDLKANNQKYDGLQSRFTDISKTRTVSAFSQYSMLFKRNWQYLLRNPRTLNAIFFNSVFVALLILALYWNIGHINNSILYPIPQPKKISGKLFDWLGLALLLANNLTFSSTMIVILAMPCMVPVFKREMMNKMYSPSVYLFSRYTSHQVI